MPATAEPPPAPAEPSFEDAMLAAFTPVMAPNPPTPMPAPAPTPVAAKTAEPTAAATNPSGSVPDFSTPSTPAPAEETPSTSAQWKQYKETQQAKFDALQKEHETLKKSRGETNGDYESIKKQNEDLNKRLAAHAIEKHPKFVEYFDGRVKQQVDAVARLGGDVGKKIASIITQPESEYRNATLNDLMEQLSTVDRSKIGAVMVQLDNIQSERQAEIAKADQTYAKMNQDQSSQYEQRKSQLEKVAYTELDRARKAIPFLQNRDGDDQWNQGVKSIEGKVQHLLHGKLSDEQVARAAIWSAVSPQLLQELNSRNARVTELEAHIARIQAATPDPSIPSALASAPSEDPNEDFGSRIARMTFGR